MTKKDKAIKDVFLSLFYSGYAPIAPGTAGSAFAVILGAPIVYYSQESIFLLSLLIALIAIKQIDRYEILTQTHDDRSIVIDELVGVWIAMSILGFGVIECTLAFVLFRIFDVWKPSIIGKIDKEIKGGLGVIGDDALAGVIAGICGLIVLYAINFIKASFV